MNSRVTLGVAGYSTRVAWPHGDCAHETLILHRRSVLILMLLMFSLSFIFMGTRRALRSNRNDVKKWLPDGFQETLDHAWFETISPTSSSSWPVGKAARWTIRAWNSWPRSSND